MREAANGVLRHDERFGYLELPRHIQLRDAVNLEIYDGNDEYGEIEFTVGRTFQIRKNHFERDDQGNYIRDDEEDSKAGNPDAHQGISSGSAQLIEGTIE